tara:strand:- start:234 stop:386 length:153 start_codon:yes stop_codon:yes gene_type:complete
MDYNFLYKDLSTLSLERLLIFRRKQTAKREAIEAILRERRSAEEEKENKK